MEKAGKAQKMCMKKSVLTTDNLILNLKQADTSFSKIIDSDFNSIQILLKEITEFLVNNLKDTCINLWCLQEMLANAVEHGNKNDPKKKVYIDVYIINKMVVFIVEDEGAGFDWQKKVNQEQCLLADKERGRGIVMSKLMSSYLLYNEKGNQVAVLYDLKDNNRIMCETIIK